MLYNIIEMPRVIKCRNCYEFQMTTANKIFKCVKCNKSFPIQNLRTYFQSDSPQACSQVVKKLKEEEFKIKGNYGEDDFFNYEFK